MADSEPVEKVVVALGGNALQSKKSNGIAASPRKVVKKTCKFLAKLSAEDYEMAVVHGNGPQVGRILLSSETAKDVVPPMPLEVCGAMSQGYIGYHIQQALKHKLAKLGINYPATTMITQTVIDKDFGAELLAEDVDAGILLILTEVEKV